MPKHFDYIVLGGGFAGWSLVDHLLQLGCESNQIALVESRLSATGASSVPWALMHPVPGRSLYPRAGYLEAWQYSLEYLAQKQSQSVQPLFHVLPVGRQAYDQATAQRFEKSFQRALVSEFKDIYPIQKSQSFEQQALEIPLAQYVITQGRLLFLAAIIHVIQAQNQIKNYEYTGKIAFEPCETGWKLNLPTQILTCHHLILATGAGLTQTLVKDTAIPLEVSQGELALFRADQDLTIAISAAGQFVVPLGQGIFYTGATHYQSERQIPPEESWQKLQQGLSWFKDIQHAQLLRIWHGQRINATDREPLVGQIQAGLWLMSGFSTRGGLLIPLAARALSQQLIDPQAPIPAGMNCQRYLSTK